MPYNPNVTIKPITLTHNIDSAVLDMWNSSADLDPLTPELWQEFVYNDPDFKPETTLVAFDGDKPIAFIMGVVRESGIGYIKMMLVAKSYRRQKMGTWLLQLMEEKLAKQKAFSIRAGEAPPAYFIPGIDPRSTATVAFFQKNGYERFGEGYHMHCNLVAEDWETATAEHQLRQKGLEIRRATASDFGPMMVFLERYFKAWQFEVAASFQRTPIAVHLGLRDGQILGFAAFDGTHSGLPWFGPMGTDPNERKLGIGAVLLRRCLRDQKEQGYTYSVIPWVGPYAFYAAHTGAEISRIFWRFQKNLQPNS